MSTYPCAVCGIASTAAFEGVPVCAEHHQMACTYYTHHTRKLEVMVAQMTCVLREKIRTHLLEGQTL